MQDVFDLMVANESNESVFKFLDIDTSKINSQWLKPYAQQKEYTHDALESFLRIDIDERYKFILSSYGLMINTINRRDFCNSIW